MSIKNNTTSLQSLLEMVNSLPEAENLDTEILTQTTLLSEQDAKIAELAQVLAGKAGGGGGSNSGNIETITVDCSTIPRPAPESEIIYLDGTMTLRRENLSRSVYTIAKNTIFATSEYMGATIDGCPLIIGSIQCRIFLATK